MTPQREYLSTTQVQRELGLTPQQMHELISTGRLPAFQILGHWRIERRMLEQMVDRLYEESLAADVLPDHECGPGADSSTPHSPRAGDAQVTPAATARTPPPAGMQHLTAHQNRVLRLVAEGQSNAEIAATLSLEVSTVKSHVSRILQRVNVRDREQLIALAWRSGLMCDAGSRDPVAGRSS